jgi:hypothetical protein
MINYQDTIATMNELCVRDKSPGTLEKATCKEGRSRTPTRTIPYNPTRTHTL